MELAPDFDEFIGSLTAHGVDSPDAGGCGRIRRRAVERRRRSESRGCSRDRSFEWPLPAQPYVTVSGDTRDQREAGNSPVPG